MRRPTLTVQHFIACPSVIVRNVGPQNPYTLKDVCYFIEVPADREWPVRLDDFWLYTRFYNGHGTREFVIEVAWLDSPEGEEEICEFAPIAVQFPVGDSTLSRAWRVSSVEFPGPGRYVFRLRIERGRRRLLAEEYIAVRRTA